MTTTLEIRVQRRLLEQPQSNFSAIVAAVNPILECPFCHGTGEWLDPWQALGSTARVAPEPTTDDDYYVTRHRTRADTGRRWRCHKCRTVVNEPNVVSPDRSDKYDLLAPAPGLYPQCPLCRGSVVYSDAFVSWTCSDCGVTSWEVDWVNYAGAKYRWTGHYKPTVEVTDSHYNSSDGAERHADAYHRVADR